MFSRLRPRLTYGNVMSTVAVFIALGGTSYAAVTNLTGKNVKNNSLTGADIKNLTGADVKNDSLDGRDIKNLKTGDISNGSLLAEDFAAGQFPFLTQGQGDGRYLTPSGGDSRYLTPSQGDSRYMADSGEIRLNAAPMMWQNTNASFTGSRLPGIGETTFGNTTTASPTSASPVIEPTLPTVLMGKPLSLVGVNLCYATPSAPVVLDYVNINTTTNTAGGANTAPLLQDLTDRTDDACRDYTLSTPHRLATNEDVSIELNVDYTANAQSFSAGRATFIFQR